MQVRVGMPARMALGCGGAPGRGAGSEGLRYGGCRRSQQAWSLPPVAEEQPVSGGSPESPSVPASRELGPECCPPWSALLRGKVWPGLTARRRRAWVGAPEDAAPSVVLGSWEARRRGGRHRKPARLGRARDFTTSAGWGAPGAPGRRWPCRLRARPPPAPPGLLHFPAPRLRSEGTCPFGLPSSLGSVCSFWSH